MRLLCLLLLLCASCALLRSTDEPPLEPIGICLATDSATAALPPYLVPPPAGSTPPQVRRWRRAQATNLARAGHAPAKVVLRHSSVATGTNAQATTVTNARAPVATGTSKAQDFTKAGQHGGGLATEPGATVDVTNRTGIPPWLILAVLIALLAILFRKILTRLY